MARPPAILVGTELSGLGVARPLAKADIPVWGVAIGAPHPAERSRALEVRLDDGARSRRSIAADRPRDPLGAQQVRALHAGARRDMLWRIDDPAPAMAAACQEAPAFLLRPVRQVLRSGR